MSVFPTVSPQPTFPLLSPTIFHRKQRPPPSQPLHATPFSPSEKNLYKLNSSATHAPGSLPEPFPSCTEARALGFDLTNGLSPACGAWIRDEVSPSEARMGLTSKHKDTAGPTGEAEGLWGSPRRGLGVSLGSFPGGGDGRT